MELSKNYDPASVEDKWYKHWLDKGYFKSSPDGRKAFTVVIPPPNVTGVLHMGHTLNETVQDILVRRARMSGFNACWVPGSDHASIATEARVVNMLKERGIDKSQLSREAFLEYAYEWKDKYGGIIYHQIAKLGCSVDWDRVSFTMDPDYYKAVIKIFVDLYKKGWIYRGARMINWDPAAKTALSDEEVEYKEVQGKLYYVKYLVIDDSWQLTVDSNVTDNYITIATQRPETIMGDTAVCVNPNDDRYAHLKGKSVIVPLVNRKAPVIFDDYVDPSFGTGALKVTPAHDINDYNLGLKHNLPIIDTLNEDGTLSEAAEVFVGMDRFEARKAAVDQLRAEGLLLKEEDYQTRIGFSQRSNAVVEPRISTQWFVKMKELSGPALKAVTDGDITIHPGDKFLATYKYWLENVKDWCISRQLWWGQQIPAWYDEKGNVFVAETEQEASEQAVAQALSYELRATSKEGSDLEAHSSKLSRDEDVLDTWFSSWLWPIEVFKGITQPGNDDINYYYPTSVLVTGQDIIFFWVARMIMAGFEFKKEKPFSDVYFTGMVRDKQGRKMSKSLGNSPDLLALIDKYGTDAVRFGIMISSPAGNDLLFDEAALEQGRNFNNKLWNALKLIKIVWIPADPENLGYGFANEGETFEVNKWIRQPEHCEFATKWFENKLNQSKAEIEELYKKFRLSEILKILYVLIWDDFCSWYLEWIKPEYGKKIDYETYESTVYFFKELMQILHPFMPFITEEVYHHINEEKDDLCVKQFTEVKTVDQDILKTADLLKKVISSIREFRNKSSIKPKDQIKIYIQSQTNWKTYYSLIDLIGKQVNAGTIQSADSQPANTSAIVIQKDKFFIEAEIIEIDNQILKNALLTELNYLKGFLVSVNKKLSNDRFVQNAKPEVIDLERKKQADAEAKIRVIEESLAGIVGRWPT